MSPVSYCVLYVRTVTREREREKWEQWWGRGERENRQVPLLIEWNAWIIMTIIVTCGLFFFLFLHWKTMLVVVYVGFICVWCVMQLDHICHLHGNVEWKNGFPPGMRDMWWTESWIRWKTVEEREWIYRLLSSNRSIIRITFSLCLVLSPSLDIGNLIIWLQNRG